MDFSPLLNMAKIQIKISDHLIVPFGRPKWNIDRIKIVGVSTNATYIESDTPLVHIDKSDKKALRLRNFREVFPDNLPDGLGQQDAIAFMLKHLKETCNLDTDFEKRFLDLYFEYCREVVTPTEWELRRYDESNLPPPKNDPDWLFDALLPLPQAHLYLSNPLTETYSFVPENMVKVDFAFWTGQQIIAVEVDGSSHVGSEAHIQKDRLLQRAGVIVIHILNGELLKHGKKVISHLLPSNITHFWKTSEYTYRSNPLDMPF